VVTVPGYEFLYAERQKKKTWVIMAGEHYRRDRPLAKRDLPSEPDHPDFDGYQAERRVLQQAYIQRLKAEYHLRHHAGSDTELDNIVPRLRDELGGLQRRWERQHRRLMGAIVGVLIGLLILGGGGWWAYRSLHQDAQQANVVTAERIHAHLLQTVGQTYRQQLAGQTRRRTGKIASACARRRWRGDGWRRQHMPLGRDRRFGRPASRFACEPPRSRCYCS